MAMPSLKGKKYEVDGNSYTVAVTVKDIDSDNGVHLRITIRAEFGNRSFCSVTGLVNRSFWHDYPAIEEMRKRSISITPSVVCKIIRHVRKGMWQPDQESANRNYEIDNEVLASLVGKNNNT
ncbi:hypothetical protein Mal52_45280 [Symmachiella dynata]|uniref:Uncharacterized protein n=1 Tax=Symmachiella dynata TaxID=2527995 RepID=A0A517ZU81_9PLAN|nr:hypothetical protein [Symmachiella dynata]QDU46031.1 hypothetical protein Mal52_45280 [Symmachiella dynata]